MAIAEAIALGKRNGATLGGVGDGAAVEERFSTMYHDVFSSMWRYERTAQQQISLGIGLFGGPSEAQGSTSAAASSSPLVDDERLGVSTQALYNYSFYGENEDEGENEELAKHGDEEDGEARLQAADRAMSRATIFNRAGQTPPSEIQAVLEGAQQQQQYPDGVEGVEGTGGLDGWIDAGDEVEDEYGEFKEGVGEQEL